MGWNWGPSRNFFSHCFDEFQRDGEIGRDFSRTSGWKFDVQENKKKFHPRGTSASALDLGGARWGGVIKLGLSEYVFCLCFCSGGVRSCCCLLAQFTHRTPLQVGQALA